MPLGFPCFLVSNNVLLVVSLQHVLESGHKMRIAVTGANGDLGSNLVPYLASQGHTTVSIDRSPPVLQKPVSTSQHYVVDVRNFGEVIASLEGCEAVIHLAAHRSPLNMPPPVVYAENTAGSFNVLFAAATLGIRRVCMASSINAIGVGGVMLI